MLKTGLLLMFTLLAGTCFAAGNLIKNGDFLELDAKGKPVGWCGIMDPQSGVDTVVHPEGRNSYRIKDGEKMLSTMVPVEGGKTYKVNYLLKTDSFNWLSAASFQILWHGKDGKPLFQDIDGKPNWIMKIKNSQGGHNWSPIEMSDCTAPEDAVSAEVRLGIVFEPVGSAWFTAISMVGTEPGDSFANRVAAIPYDKGNNNMKDFFNEGNWENSAELADFIVPTTGTRAKYKTNARVKYDDDAIYVNLQAFQPASDKLGAESRRNFDQQDAVEILLAPPGSEFQYHILLNPNGKLFTCTEKWNDGNWPMKLHEWENNGVETVIEYKPDFWRAGLKIPFKGMNQAMPRDGAQWRASFCRSVFTGEQEASAWAFLKEPHFQFAGDFGEIIFSKDIPRLRDIRITAAGASLEIRNTANKEIELGASFVRHARGNASLTAPKKIKVAPGQNTIYNLQEAAQGADMRFLEIREGDKLLAKHCNRASETYLALGVFDPEGVRGKTMNIAVDTPFFMAFNFRHNLDVKGAHKLLWRKAEAFDLHMEIPEGLKISGMMFDAGNWLQTPLIKPEISQAKNKGMNVYKFEMPFIIDWAEPSFLFFYECGLPEGQDYTGAYYLTRNGAPLPKNELHFRTMKVGKVKKTPERFFHESVLMGANSLYYWLPKNTIAAYRALGMNRVEIMVEPGKNTAPYVGDQPKSREDFYDLLFAEIKAEKLPLFITTIGTSSGPQAWQWTDKDQDARAIGVDGKDAPYNQYNYPSLCPNYRGKFFQEYTDHLVNSYAFKKFHCTWLSLDMELWPPSVWSAICYCPRCLGKFKEYCGKHKPEWAGRDPRAVMKEGKDEGFKKLWEDFKMESYRDLLATTIGRVKKSVEGYPMNAPRGEFAAEDWAKPEKKYEGLINYFEVPLYNSPDVNYKALKKGADQWGSGRRDIVYSSTLGQTAACPDFHVTPIQVKEQLFEAAAFGMQGMLWYYYLYMEPLRWKYVIEGIDALTRVEDIVLDGHMVKTISSDNQELLLTRRDYNDQSVLGVRAYGASKDLTGKITLDGIKSSMEVYDCDTQERIGSVTAANPTFEITVPKHRCRLLYVGASSEWAKRRN